MPTSTPAANTHPHHTPVLPQVVALAFGETLAGSHMYRNRECLQGLARPMLTDSTAVTRSPRLTRNGLCPGPRRAAQRSNQGGGGGPG